MSADYRSESDSGALAQTGAQELQIGPVLSYIVLSMHQVPFQFPHSIS